MRSKLFYLFSVLFFIGFTIQAQQPLPADAEAFYQKAMRSINQKHINWVKTTAQTVKTQKMDEAAIRKSAGGYAKLNNLSGMDIDALVSFVMMQVTKDEEQDLKNALQEMDKINKQKQQLRDAENKMKQQQNSMKRELLDSFRLIAKPVTTTKTQPVKRTNVVMNSQASASEIKQVQDALKNKLDSTNEMSEQTSIRLQMMMDRRSKFISTLSNIMKKISQTQDGIIQNMK